MAEPISNERAEAFAKALLANGGNRTAAARNMGYRDPNRAGYDLSRHALVLKYLQPMAQQQLASLTPRAIQTLAGLLTNKSGYIRLEAAKDILNRNGVGADRNTSIGSPLLISIKIGQRDLQSVSGGSAPEHNAGSEPEFEPGGRKLDAGEPTRSPTHDFPEKVISVERSPAYDFSPKVQASEVSKVIDLDATVVSSSEPDWSLD